MKRALSWLLPLVVLALAPAALAQDVLDDGSAPLPDDLGAFAPPALEETGPGGGHATPPDPTYAGMHPLDGGGYCYERGMHVHPYAPAEQLAPYYRDCGGAYCFVGDPLPFGYLGNVTAYDGYHPLLLVAAQSYCYLSGFHYHVFAPSQDWSAWYAFFSGAWAYRGTPTVAFERDRGKYEREEPTYTNLAPFQRSMRDAAKYYTKAARDRLRRTRGRGFAGTRHAAMVARGRSGGASALKASRRSGGAFRGAAPKRSSSSGGSAFRGGAGARR